MSGLLVKSTVVMKENLQEMNARGVAAVPVLLGGAALTRSYVENDLSDVYEGRVSLRAGRVRGPAADGRHDGPAPRRRDRRRPRRGGRARRAQGPPRAQQAHRGQAQGRRGRGGRADARRARTSRATTRSRRRRSGAPGWSRAWRWPTTPGWSTSAPLFLGQWGLRGARGGTGPSYEELVETEGRPRLRYWLDRLSTEGVLAHAAVVYGYFPAVAEGDELVVLARADGPTRRSGTGSRSRASAATGTCAWPTSCGRAELAGERGEVDVLPLHLVTMGQPIADYANELFAEGRLPRLPGGARPRRAAHRGAGRVLAPRGSARSWLRRRGGGGRGPDDVEEYFKLGYRGARYSLGYGACPNLDDRVKIVDLLQPERIGVTLSEELQLHPEQSTDAMVAHHPEAKYFNAG